MPFQNLRSELERRQESAASASKNWRKTTAAVPTTNPFAQLPPEDNTSNKSQGATKWRRAEENASGWPVPAGSGEPSSQPEPKPEPKTNQKDETRDTPESKFSVLTLTSEDVKKSQSDKPKANPASNPKKQPIKHKVYKPSIEVEVEGWETITIRKGKASQKARQIPLRNLQEDDHELEENPSPSRKHSQKKKAKEDTSTFTPLPPKKKPRQELEAEIARKAQNDYAS
ncbi:hypothetical protein G7Y89_g14741 [Cudoniella acicularis]|uniref:Uncharacterized protein n=1 Tax=Cudoniella acicularis TaxID=354080 RepID=A0A8H4QYP4_9HELO|nr:hypothetical protein G7Y89_g14741 [Cudoniella acicularis]